MNLYELKGFERHNVRFVAKGDGRNVGGSVLFLLALTFVLFVCFYSAIPMIAEDSSNVFIIFAISPFFFVWVYFFYRVVKGFYEMVTIKVAITDSQVAFNTNIGWLVVKHSDISHANYEKAMYSLRNSRQLFEHDPKRGMARITLKSGDSVYLSVSSLDSLTVAMDAVIRGGSVMSALRVWKDTKKGSDRSGAMLGCVVFFIFVAIAVIAFVVGSVMSAMENSSITDKPKIKLTETTLYAGNYYPFEFEFADIEEISIYYRTFDYTRLSQTLNYDDLYGTTFNNKIYEGRISSFNRDFNIKWYIFERNLPVHIYIRATNSQWYALNLDTQLETEMLARDICDRTDLKDIPKYY